MHGHVLALREQPAVDGGAAALGGRAVLKDRARVEVQVGEFGRPPPLVEDAVLHSPHDVEDHRLLVAHEAVAAEEDLARSAVDARDARLELETLPALEVGAELAQVENVAEVDGRPALADRARLEHVERRAWRVARMRRDGSQRDGVQRRLLQLEGSCRVLGLLEWQPVVGVGCGREGERRRASWEAALAGRAPVVLFEEALVVLALDDAEVVDEPWRVQRVVDLRVLDLSGQEGCVRLGQGHERARRRAHRKRLCFAPRHNVLRPICVDPAQPYGHVQLCEATQTWRVLEFGLQLRLERVGLGRGGHGDGWRSILVEGRRCRGEGRCEGDGGRRGSLGREVRVERERDGRRCCWCPCRRHCRSACVCLSQSEPQPAPLLRVAVAVQSDEVGPRVSQVEERSDDRGSKRTALLCSSVAFLCSGPDALDVLLGPPAVVGLEASAALLLVALLLLKRRARERLDLLKLGA